MNTHPDVLMQVLPQHLLDWHMATEHIRQVRALHTAVPSIPTRLSTKDTVMTVQILGCVETTSMMELRVLT